MPPEAEDGADGKDELYWWSAYDKDNSFFVFGPDSSVRVFCTELVEHPYFDKLVLGIIVFSTCMMALDSPVMYPPGSKEAEVLTAVNSAVNIFFYGELLIHSIVHGFYFRPNAYLRQDRFTLDWVVVLCTLVETVITEAGLMSDFPSLKPLRSIRALRALRAFRFLNEVIAILDTLAVAYVPMSNIFKVYIFLMAVFSILGISTMKGTFRTACKTAGGDEMLSDGGQDRRTCTGDYYGTLVYDADETRITSAQSQEGSGFTCPKPFYCITGEGQVANPKRGYASFDDVAWAIFTTFQVSSLDGWGDIQYFGQDATSAVNWIFYVSVVVLMNFFLLQLFCAVLFETFAEVRASYELEEEADMVSMFEEERERLQQAPDSSPREIDDAHASRKLDKARGVQASPTMADLVDDVMDGVDGPARDLAMAGGVTAGLDDLEKEIDTDEAETETDLEALDKTIQAAEAAVSGDPEALTKPGTGTGSGSTGFPTMQSSTGLEMSAFDSPGTVVGLTGPPGTRDAYSVGEDQLTPSARTPLDGLKPVAEAAGSPSEALSWDLYDPSYTLSEWTLATLEACPWLDNAVGRGMMWVWYHEDPERGGDGDWKDDPPGWEGYFGELIAAEGFGGSINVCIMLNCGVMMMEHDDGSDAGMTHEWEMVGVVAEIFFTAAFLGEMFCKFLGMGGLRYYFCAYSNVFDFVLVVTAIPSVVSSIVGTSGGVNLSMLRVLRLFRVFRAFRTLRMLRTMKELVDVIISALKAIVNLSVFILFASIIGGIVGMYVLAGKSVDEDGENPRLNFDNFPSSVLTLFVVMTGDAWTDILHNAISGGGFLGGFFVTLWFCFSNYVLLSAFAAVILENFALSHRERVSLQIRLYGAKIEQFKQQEELARAVEKMPGQNGGGPTDAAIDLNSPSDSTGSPKSPSKITEMQAEEGDVVAGAGQQYRQGAGFKKKGAGAANSWWELPAPDESYLTKKDKIWTRKYTLDAYQRHAKWRDEWHALQMAELAKEEGESTDDPEDPVSTPAAPPPRHTPAEQSKYGGRRLSHVSIDADETRPATLAVEVNPERIEDQQEHYAEVKGDRGNIGKQVQRKLQGKEEGAEPKVAPLVAATLAVETAKVTPWYQKPVGQADDLARQYAEDEDMAALEDDFEEDYDMSEMPLHVEYSLAYFSVEHPVRVFCFEAANSSAFEYFIVVVILVSSVFMAMQSPWRPDEATESFMAKADTVFLIIFTVEMTLKIVGLGFRGAKTAYIDDPWNRLDFFCVCASYTTLLVSSFPDSIGRLLRVVRALRPLRMLNKSENVKAVFGALLRSISGVFNVFILVFFFTFLFALIGMSFFMAKFKSCNWEDAVGQLDCLGTTENENHGYVAPKVWANGVYSFDDIGAASLAVFEIAGCSWTDALESAVDVTDKGLQPVKWNQPANSVFFVLVIVIVSFFVVNIVIGVICEKFNQSSGRGLLTDKQNLMRDTLLILMTQSATVKPKRPRFGTRAFFYDITHHRNFNDFLVFIILLSGVILASEHVGQPTWLTDFISASNFVFAFIFFLEMAMKVVALTPKVYFEDNWNVFDFCIVATTLVMIPVEIWAPRSAINPRPFRLLMLFRIIKRDPGVRLMVTTMLMALPALLNCGALLFLLLFFYSIVGMQMFGTLRYGTAIGPHGNFRNCSNAMLLLFRLLTGDNAFAYMRDCMVQPPLCTDNETELAGYWLPNDCGSPVMGVIYHLSFYISSNYAILNLFTAVIVDNYSFAYNLENKDVEETGGSLDAYNRKWFELAIPAVNMVLGNDPNADDLPPAFIEGQYLPLHLIKDLMLSIGLPLGIPDEKPVSMRRYKQIRDEARVKCQGCAYGVTYNQLKYSLLLNATGIAPLPYEEWSQRRQELESLEYHRAAAQVQGMLQGMVGRQRTKTINGNGKDTPTGTRLKLSLRRATGLRGRSFMREPCSAIKFAYGRESLESAVYQDSAEPIFEENSRTPNP